MKTVALHLKVMSLILKELRELTEGQQENQKITYVILLKLIKKVVVESNHHRRLKISIFVLSAEQRNSSKSPINFTTL